MQRTHLRCCRCFERNLHAEIRDFQIIEIIARHESERIPKHCYIIIYKLKHYYYFKRFQHLCGRGVVRCLKVTAEQNNMLLISRWCINIIHRILQISLVTIRFIADTSVYFSLDTQYCFRNLTGLHIHIIGFRSFRPLCSGKNRTPPFNWLNYETW